MSTTAIPSPGTSTPREEWNDDADFDFPDGDPIHASDAESEKEDDIEEDLDWDVELDLGKTGGAKARPSVGGSLTVTATGLGGVGSGDGSRMFTIRPPLTPIGDEDDEDAIPTIKAADLPNFPSQSAPEAAFDEDFEDGFALPSDLTRLSLRPLELNHRASKSSLEWGDKDHTTSSQSSDAYSTLGFADHSPPSTVYTSTSLPETETEDEDEEVEDMLDGLVVPNGLFESGQSAKKLTKILETKKKAIVTDMRVKIASPDPEDDFESGLVFEHDMELSPSRLLQAAQQTIKFGSGTTALRSKSVPRASTLGRPQSRSKSERARSPNVPPISSSQQLSKLACPPSPPKPSSSRTQTYSQAVTSATSISAKSSFLAPKYSSLRGQKSHTVLKAPSPSGSRGLSRKASLPSLSDHNPAPPVPSRPDMSARYNAPTASSKAKHTNSTGRLHTFDYNVPPTRPSTPSSNPAVLRLTMPTSSSRLKTRPPISNVFMPSPVSATPPLRSTSPLPSPLPTGHRPPSASSSRPPSAKSRHAQTQSLPGVSAAKVLKRPKRTRTYGDGTELDDFEDLPLDREKEGKYRVQPKGIGNRVPGATYASIVAPSLSRKPQKPDTAGSKTLKRSSRIEFSPSKPVDSASHVKKRKPVNSPQTRRKPTLIRNLGGSGGPKVVGEMKWNPQTLRWEGNDQVLRDFDAAVGTSTRPALITHLTGSSIGSPVNSFAAGARKVGNMIFDPSKMCWISTLPPDEEEPDVFANLADDEDDENWDANTRTIRAAQQLAAASGCETPQAAPTSGSAITRTRSRSESESDRCSRASMVCDVEEGFFDKCRAAEQRHRAEMRGWTTTADTDRSFLYEIRALATRQY